MPILPPMINQALPFEIVLQFLSEEELKTVNRVKQAYLQGDLLGAVTDPGLPPITAKAQRLSGAFEARIHEEFRQALGKPPLKAPHKAPLDAV